jgi:hypothetical protein
LTFANPWQTICGVYLGFMYSSHRNTVDDRVTRPLMLLLLILFLLLLLLLLLLCL